MEPRVSFRVVFEITTLETTLETTSKITSKILRLLSENPKITSLKLAETIGDITLEGVKYNLKKLKEEGRIQRVGPTKGGYWKIVK